MTLATSEIMERGNGAMERQAEKSIVEDAGQFANLLDTGRFNHMWRVAQMFASTQMVPQCFQNKPQDCFVAIQMAVRLGVDPFMFLQNTFIVYGRPGMEAKLAIALVNSSGLFTDPLDYEIVGDNPNAKDYKVRANATRTGTGKVVHGPWVDWATVKAEKWDAKTGSKWLSIPALMFQYRAATFFARLHCPERLMGMQTVDELEDVGSRDPQRVEVRQGGTKAVAAKLLNHPTAENLTIDPSTSNEPPADADPDVSGGQDEPPADAAPVLATFEDLVEAAEGVARQTQVDPEVFERAMAAAKLNVTDVTRAGAKGDKARATVLAAMTSGRWDWNAGKVLT